MKIFKTIFVLIFLFMTVISVNSFGVENKNQISREIKTLIEKVKTAPPEEKYKYMNQLKIIIRNLHSEERKKIMKELIKELKGKQQKNLYKTNNIKKSKNFNERNNNKERIREIKQKMKEEFKKKRKRRNNH